MGAAMEIITGRAVNAGASFTPLTMATGDSLAVRNFDVAAGAFLENMWASGATAGTFRVRSPRLHDNVQGIRVGYVAAGGVAMLPEEIAQPLYPQDVLIGELTGGGAETDVASLLIYYASLPGANSSLRRWAQVKPNIRNILTVETDHTAGATAGDYGGALAINANFDLLKANTWYAILGYETPANLHAVGWRSPDFGNFRIGAPGTTDRLESRRWFVKNDLAGDLAFIPCFNSANKGSTLVDIVNTAAGGTFNVQTVLAELSS